MRRNRRASYEIPIRTCAIRRCSGRRTTWDETVAAGRAATGTEKPSNSCSRRRARSASWIGMRHAPASNRTSAGQVQELVGGGTDDDNVTVRFRSHPQTLSDKAMSRSRESSASSTSRHDLGAPRGWKTSNLPVFKWRSARGDLSQGPHQRWEPRAVISGCDLEKTVNLRVGDGRGP